MNYMAAAVPATEKLRLPWSRDQIMLLMAALNEIFLGVDIYLAHNVSGTIVPNEWIPIIFGPIAGLLLLLAGVLAISKRHIATLIANVIFVASIGVGLLGAYFHLVRAILPTAPIGERVTVDLIVWAPPVLGPLTFSLVGLLGISAAWVESPPDSGRLLLWGGRSVQLPYSKTRAFLFLAGMGSLATLISSVLDHARTDFSNPWLWVPTAVGVFASITAVALGAMDKPRPGEVRVFILAMVLMILVGVVGVLLHVSENLISNGEIVGERFLRGAPFMAPLLFANMGALGLIALLDPRESKH
jgi:hypothetical protein